MNCSLHCLNMSKEKNNGVLIIMGLLILMLFVSWCEMVNLIVEMDSFLRAAVSHHSAAKLSSHCCDRHDKGRCSHPVLTLRTTSSEQIGKQIIYKGFSIPENFTSFYKEHNQCHNSFSYFLRIVTPLSTDRKAQQQTEK